MIIIYKGLKFELTFQEFFPLFMDYTWLEKPYYDSFEDLSGYRHNAISFYTQGGQLKKYMPQDISSKTGTVLRKFLEEKRLIKQYQSYTRGLEVLQKLVNKNSQLNLTSYSTQN